MKLTVSMFLLLNLFQCHFLNGATDTLIKFSDLSFKNDFEKITFRQFHLQGKKADIVDLFLTHYTNKENYSATKAHQLINDCVNDLKKETENMSDAKKVKFTYRHVHKRFFKLYKAINSFSDIFEKGEFNCVSGSALYAIIFQMMGIPYQIVEAPQHVFIFAYPETHKIMIETTIPENGYLMFTDAYIEKFTNYLYEEKLITREQYESNTKNQLFEKYYFSTKGMNLQELAAIQYANYAFYYGNDNENDKALDEIKKAYFINPSERMKYVLQSLLRHVIANRNYDDLSDVNNLSILCRQNGRNNKEVSNENIKYEFERLTTEQLITKVDYQRYSKSYEKISESISDSTLQKDITFYYHYELARVGYHNSKEKYYVFRNLIGAYRIKPTHVDLQAMIKSYFASLVEKSNDPDLIMKQIDEFMQTFDFLGDDQQFNLVRANCLLELAYRGFLLKDITMAENYLNSFENLCSKNADLKPDDRFVEKAYSTAATYYYKKGNTNKTKQVLKTGIKYAPQSFGLKMRLKQVN